MAQIGRFFIFTFANKGKSDMVQILIIKTSSSKPETVSVKKHIETSQLHTQLDSHSYNIYIYFLIRNLQRNTTLQKCLIS